MHVKSDWFITPQQTNITPKIHLFCFHHAGGNASVFHSWKTNLPHWVETIPVELPGRGRRISTQPIDNIEDVIEQLLPFFEPYRDQSIALYGHSMGARICYELARKLSHARAINPKLIIVAGCRALHLPENESCEFYRRKVRRNHVPLHKLPDDGFIDEIARINGTPTEVIRNKELMKLCIPFLKSDFKLVEDYSYSTESSPTPNIPIAVFGGTDDPNVSMDDLSPWQELTAHKCSVDIFPGDHFFTKSCEQNMLTTITNLLESALMSEDNPKNDCVPLSYG